MIQSRNVIIAVDLSHVLNDLIGLKMAFVASVCLNARQQLIFSSGPNQVVNHHSAYQEAGSKEHQVHTQVQARDGH